MKKILLLILICLPTAAYSQAIFDLSCDNVARMRIFRLKASGWRIESYGGFFHLLELQLKPVSAQAFAKLLKAAPTVVIKQNNMNSHMKSIILTANGGPLRNDLPLMTGLDAQGITIGIFLKEDAFDAARSVCPALVPTKLLEDGKWE